MQILTRNYWSSKICITLRLNREVCVCACCCCACCCELWVQRLVSTQFVPLPLFTPLVAIVFLSLLYTHCFPFPQCTWFWCWQLCFYCRPSYQLFSLSAEMLKLQFKLAVHCQVHWQNWSATNGLFYLTQETEAHNLHHQQTNGNVCLLSSSFLLFNLFHLIWAVINDANVIIARTKGASLNEIIVSKRALGSIIETIQYNHEAACLHTSRWWERC